MQNYDKLKCICVVKGINVEKKIGMKTGLLSLIYAMLYVELLR